jgi:hypothetical protein
MNPMLQSFLSTALPIVLAVLFGIWTNNKQLDGLSRRLDYFARRLDRIETILDRIEQRLAFSR